MKFICPVCGYPNLEEQPRSEEGGGSYEICPSCWFQFGYDDDDQGITYEEWRRRWVERGMCWSSRGIKPLPDWNPREQLRGIEKEDDSCVKE